jgi:hypothetical protein
LKSLGCFEEKREPKLPQRVGHVIVKNMAVVASAGSKLQDVPLAELAKLCKGTQKMWADGRNFTRALKGN